MITFKPFLGGTKVFIGRDMLGTISTVKGGYHYQPRGSKLVGEVFATLNACKHSLQN